MAKPARDLMKQRARGAFGRRTQTTLSPDGHRQAVQRKGDRAAASGPAALFLELHRPGSGDHRQRSSPAARDWIFPTYREHPVPLMRGVRLKELFDHLIANAADHAKGRNLPPEYSFRHINFVSISAPVGTQVPQATGFAHAARMNGEDLVVLAYCGEGATSEGDFHIGLNFAGVWKAPVDLLRPEQWMGDFSPDTEADGLGRLCGQSRGLRHRRGSGRRK